MKNTRPGGEIGRRRGLKIPRREACRFESDPGHHTFNAASLQRSCRCGFFMVEVFWNNPLTDKNGPFLLCKRLIAQCRQERGFVRAPGSVVWLSKSRRPCLKPI